MEAVRSVLAPVVSEAGRRPLKSLACQVPETTLRWPTERSRRSGVKELAAGTSRMTRGWAFAHMALTHSYGHFYEAGVVRGLLGFPGN